MTKKLTFTELYELFEAADAAWQAMWPWRGYTNTAVVVSCERLRNAVNNARYIFEEPPEIEPEEQPVRKHGRNG